MHLSLIADCAMSMCELVYVLVITIFMKLTAQKGKGDRGKRTSDRTRTLDPRSIAELQPREIEVTFHLRLANSCNVLGTTEPATIT